MAGTQPLRGSRPSPQWKGVDLGDNQIRQLQKIEELTLYLIEQDKKNAALEEKVRQLEERNRALESLEQRIERLERSSGHGDPH